VGFGFGTHVGFEMRAAFFSEAGAWGRGHQNTKYNVSLYIAACCALAVCNLQLHGGRY
jgi:hypothetical protein